MTRNERRIKVAKRNGWACVVEDHPHFPMSGLHPRTGMRRPLPDCEGDATLWAAMLIELQQHTVGFRLDYDDTELVWVLTTNTTLLNAVPEINVRHESLAAAVIEAWIAWKESV